MRVAILGSCVTRDLFDVVETGWSVARYIGRQSMIGFIHPPLKLDFRAGKTTGSTWMDSMARLNATKTSFDLLAGTEFDTLIVDLIDERCACLSTRGGSRMTYSPELQTMSEGTALLEQNGLTPLFDEWPYMDEREDALDHFARELARCSRGRPIVLHQAYWSDHAAGEQRVNFDINWVRRNNDLLALCYTGLKRRLNLMTVAAPQAVIVGDGNHKWGAAPYHYVQAYYEAVFDQLKTLRVYGLPTMSRKMGEPMNPAEKSNDVDPSDRFPLKGYLSPITN
jgi:hypothetical protein